GPFEEISLFPALHLESRRDASRKLRYRAVQERKSGLNAGQLRRAGDLGQVVIGKCDFDIHVEQTIQMVGGGGVLVMTGGDVEDRVAPQFGKEVLLKNLLGLIAGKELTREVSLHGRQVRPVDITKCLPYQTLAERQQAQSRLDQTFSQPAWRVLIRSENLVRQIPLIPPKQFIAAVARQQHLHTVVSRELGT